MPQERNGRDGLSRRAVLKGIGTSGVASIAATGVVSAHGVDTQAMQTVEARYAAPAAARAAASGTADPVLTELADRGYLDAGDASAFDFSAVGADRDDASVTGLWLDGEATAQVEATRVTDTHEVRLVVRPERDEAVATAEPLGDADPITVESADGDVSIDVCYYQTRCSCDPCDLNSCVYQERKCCEADGGYCYDWVDQGCCGDCCSDST